LHAARQVHAEHLEAVAEVRGAEPAGPAAPAELERLDDDAVTGREAASCGRLGDLAEGLVADDAALRHAVVEVALEDVEVGPADADALDSQQGLPGPRRGGGGVAGRTRAAPRFKRGPHARESHRVSSASGVDAQRHDLTPRGA